jgi:hypothetical protein
MVMFCYVEGDERERRKVEVGIGRPKEWRKGDYSVFVPATLPTVPPCFLGVAAS